MRLRGGLAPPPGRAVAGIGVTLGGIALVVAGLVPLRSDIAVETAALVLVIPIVLGVAVGGFPAAVVGAAVGFLAFDFFFIPPYGRWEVGAGEHWAGLAVYAVVGLSVGLVVAQVQRARAEAQGRAAETQVLYELSQLLAAEAGLEAALRRVLAQVRRIFGVATAAVLLPTPDGSVRVAALDGADLPEHALHAVLAHPARADPVTIEGSPTVVSVGLVSTGDVLGRLVVAGAPLDGDGRRLLAPFAGQVALALERAQLAEQATRSRMLEEVDRLRSALMGSVSHDLRTPLASIKAAVSDLLDPEVGLSDDDRQTLLATIEEETDRLARFVSNLLDMSRIEAGALELHRTATPLGELVDAVLVRLAPVLARHAVTVDVPDDLPLVDVDYVLVEQVLANLLENAARHTPPGTAVAVLATHLLSAWVEVRVADRGPGVPEEERPRIFDLFYRPATGARRPSGTGMGLAICRGVVAAHGGDIWMEPTAGGGATFVFRLPISPVGAGTAEPAPSRAEA